MTTDTLAPVVIAQEGDAVALLTRLGVAPEILEALDNRALAADGFTGVYADHVETHWLFACRFAGRSDPDSNGLIALAVSKSLMPRLQFVAHVKALLGCDISIDGSPV